MTERYQSIRIIDSHTGGEPTRLVYQGFPELGTGSMAERLNVLKTQYDQYRRAVILEPRGNDILVGALLCPPQDPAHTCGVIYFNNEGYLGMCGHGTIGLIASLHYLGRIAPGVHTVETPVGNVSCTLHADGSVSIENVRAYRYRQQVALDVPGFRRIHGDIAWGGNWFFLVNDHGLRVATDNIAELTQVSAAIMRLSTTSNSLPQASMPTAAASSSAPAAPTTARPAAPAPAPNSPVLPPTVCSPPAKPGYKKASSAASSAPATCRRRRAVSSPPCAAVPTSAHTPNCCSTRMTPSAGG